MIFRGRGQPEDLAETQRWEEALAESEARREAAEIAAEVRSNLSLVAVDLAPRYSAACWLSADGAVLGEWDSWQVSETEFIRATCLPWTSLVFHDPVALLVEDLPHRLPFGGQVKATCRIQGRLVERMATVGAAGAVVFVPPAVWRKAFHGLERGTGPEAVTAVAARLGYRPPDLTVRLLGERGEKAIARKVATDYCAAFLIADWARANLNTGTVDVPGTTRYGQIYPVTV